MSSSTFSDLCQKPNWQTQGHWLARKFARPVAVHITRRIVRLPVTANQVTVLAAFVGTIGGLSLAVPGRPALATGICLLWAWYLLDHVDGQVARYRSQQTVTGIYLDFMMHHAIHALAAFAFGFRFALETDNLFWTLAGFGFAAGIVLLSLANDCKYKAFYSQLARNNACYAPPAEGAAGRQPGFLRKALQTTVRLCEFPTIVGYLPALFVADWVFDSEVLVMRCWLLMMAFVCPLLALGRVVRQVSSGQLDQEYSEGVLPPQ